EELKAHDRGRSQDAIITDRGHAQAHADAANKNLTRAAALVEPLLKMNEKLEAAGAPLIGPETETDYAAGQRWRYLTDSTYRQVRNAIAAHATLFSAEDLSDLPVASGNPFRDVEIHQQLTETAAKANGQVEQLQLEVDTAVLRDRMLNDDQIAEKLREAIGQRAHNTTYAEQLSATFPKAGIAETLAGSVKADALETIAVDIGAQMDGIKASREQLSDPLYRLGRAGSRRVRVDLDNVAYKITGQLGYQQMRTANASRIRQDIGGYRIDSTSSSTAMYAALAMVILTSDDADAAFSAQQLSVGQDVASQAGIDLSTAKPDLSGIEGAISEAGIDIADFNLKGVDVGDFHVDVGGVGNVDVGVPSVDVSVPSIDVSVPTIDAGGGGFGGF
ncbi:MAG: hypothetical protein AAF556_05465, partial [Pseudomonadota bacterium]